MSDIVDNYEFTCVCAKCCRSLFDCLCIKVKDFYVGRTLWRNCSSCLVAFEVSKGHECKKCKLCGEVEKYPHEEHEYKKCFLCEEIKCECVCCKKCGKWKGYGCRCALKAMKKKAKKVKNR